MKALLLPFLLLLLSQSVALAQITPHQLDSLKNRASVTVKRDSVRVNLLIMIADAIAGASPGEAMRYTDEALQIAQEIKAPMGIAISYREKANLYGLLSDYVQAVDYNFRALKAANSLKKNNKGSTLFVATIYNNLGIVYLETRAYDKAITNFTRFLGAVRQLNEPTLRREESIALLNLGETYSRTKNYQKGINYASQSLQISETDNDFQLSAYNLNVIGIANINLKRSEVGIESFSKGILYADKAGDTGIKARCLGGMADALFDLKRYDKSEKYGKQALRIAKDLKLLELQREITQLLAYIYIAQKKSQPAVTYLETSLALRDSILNDDKKQEIARKEERFKQEKRTAVLNATHTAEIKQKQTERNALAGGAGLMVLASGMSFLFYKRKRDADVQLKEEQFNTQMSDTELKVLRSQIDPHFIFNALNSIGNYVLNNDPFTADRYLTKFATLMRAILSNSDRPEIPLAEDIESLELYIQLEQLRLDYRFTYIIDIDPALDQQRTLIPPLLLQPFVENSIWHGLSTKDLGGLLTIRIQKDDDMMVCTVTDNGIGREKSVLVQRARPARKSHGMSITQARIEIINRLKKANGFIKLADLTEGTEVSISVPLAVVIA